MKEFTNLFGYMGKTIGFGEERKGTMKLGDRQFSVNANSKGYQLYFGKVLAAEFKPYKRACLYFSKVTRKVFLIVSNDERCEELKPNNDGSVRIYSRDLAINLYGFFDKKKGERLTLNLSENMSYTPEFATYEITEE